jgi:hypothetical protein
MNDDLIEVDYSFRRAALIALAYIEELEAKLRGEYERGHSDGWYGNVFNP